MNEQQITKIDENNMKARAILQSLIFALEKNITACWGRNATQSAANFQYITFCSVNFHVRMIKPGGFAGNFQLKNIVIQSQFCILGFIPSGKTIGRIPFHCLPLQEQSISQKPT